MSTSEETITTTPTGADAFTAARASLADQSKDQGDKPAGDDTTPETTPAEEPAVADQPTDTTEENDALLTAEQLAELTPKDRAKAEKWQATLTKKAQALSAQGKEFDEWKPLIEALKTDATATIQRLAEERGLKILKPTEDTAAEDIPDELKFLEPFLAARDKKLEAKIRADYQPLKDGMDRITSEAIAAETESTIAQFEAKNPGWKKHEARMLELGTQFVPAHGTMTDFQYMTHLHTLATAEITEAEKTKKVVEKINKSHQNAETLESGVSDRRVEQAQPPAGERSMRRAWNDAKAGIRYVK